MSLLRGGLTLGGLLEGGVLLGGVIQGFGGLVFYASLETTLVPSIGNAPSFTRNATASVTDFWGLIRTAKVGEARFDGARRIENLVAYSEDLANDYYTKNASGTGIIPIVNSNYATAPDGTLTADRLQFDLGATPATAISRLYRVSLSTAPDNIISIFFRTADESTKTLYIIGGQSVYELATVTGDLTRFYLPPTSYYAYAQIQFGLDGSLSTSDTADIIAWGAQVEDVTGQSVQTVGEYVSSGVLSSPYHGTGADGVKYFTTTLDGTQISDSVIKGYLSEGQRTNLALYSNDFSNAVWEKSNIAHSSGTLTATAANGVMLQTVTSASQSHTFSIQIKRKTGTGNIDITLDNGAAWTTKTITTEWEKYEITQTLANPVFGIRITTSGDEIDIRYSGLEDANFSSSPILTTSASVTRNEDDLRYPISIPSEGTIYAEVRSNNSNVNSGIVSKALGIGPLNYNSDIGISFIDGTNTHVFAYGQQFSSGIRKVAARWSGPAGTMKIFKDGGASPEGAYNGAFTGGSEILIGQNNFFGSIRNIKIWSRVLSDSELMSMTS